MSALTEALVEEPFDEPEDQPGAVWRPRITPPPRTVDTARAVRAAEEMLRALGLPVDGADMRDTPRRLVDAYAELLTVPEFELTTFDNAAGYDDLVLVRDIPVRSLCEHHLLPFTGVAHVGYLPGERVLGLSKVARVVDFFARRAQTQERLTVDIAEHLLEQVAPSGVGVVVEAEHSCMTVRGARAEGARTVTAAMRGRLHEDRASRQEFWSRIQERGGHR